MRGPEVDSRPRLLEVDLDTWRREGERALEPRGWECSDPLLERVGSWSGPALALARLLAQPEEDAFALAVGECVRRGLPTAARTTVMGRSPLSGRLAEGQVGSDLGRRLASVADVLVIRGRTHLPGAVLVLGDGARAELRALPEIVGADPVATHRALRERFGPCASLRVGAAGERGVAFANLAAGDDPPSFVGRGGLGAALGRLGLKAVVLTAQPVPGVEHGELVEALTRSPRLVARGAGGTMELMQAFGVRGDLRARGYSEPLPREVGVRLAREAQDAGRERKGCKGCPTPCGWVFERTSGARQGAHFSAVYALGTNLGLEGFDDALALLAVCDRFGLDAKEAGACLALLAREREHGALGGARLWGDRVALERTLEDLALGRGDGGRLAAGAAAYARSRGLTGDAADVHGEAARRESNLASVLGQCAGARGPEPMRTFPFLPTDGVERARLVALVAPLELPPGAEDPLDPAGKGRLVVWHENLVLAIDAAGFCAFSAAGLLADGVTTLDQLAEWIAPAALADMPGGADATPGARLLAAGATLALLHHAANRARDGARDEPPAWARSDLERPGMLDEYRRFRGLDRDGAPTDEARARLGTVALLELGLDEGPAAPAAVVAPAAAVATVGRRPGRVTLACSGPLARMLGNETEVELALPCSVAEVLHAVARTHPEAAAGLVRDGRPVPAVYRAGSRLAPAEEVRTGDCLDLVVAVSGG